MGRLTVSFEADIRENIRDIALEEFSAVVKKIKEENKIFHYEKKTDFKKKLKINEAYYKKLVGAGLREVILEDGDRTIWVSWLQFNQLMDELAE